MIEVRITSKYRTDTRISDAPTVREAFDAELKAMQVAGWQVQGSRCTDNVGAIILAKKRGLEVSIIIYPRKPRKIGIFEKICKKVAKFFG